MSHRIVSTFVINQVNGKLMIRLMLLLGSVFLAKLKKFVEKFQARTFLQLITMYEFALSFVSAFFGFSSGSSLFAKVPIQGFSV